MGSGLILLIIVGAWLAVLVPMALRGHDSATSRKSTDRFADAMRVLAHRGARDILVPRRRQTLVVSGTRSARVAGFAGSAGSPHSAGSAGSAHSAGSAGSAAPLPEADDATVRRPRGQRHQLRSAADRRRRTLLVLVAVCLLTGVLGLVSWPALLIVHGLADVLLMAFIVQLRRQAVLRRQLARRRGTVGPARVRAARITGIPDRMPARPAPLATPLPAPAARYEDPLPVAVGGRDWSPVPVPPPAYARKPVAPARPTRVLDLTQPGRWSGLAELADADEPFADDNDAELDEILDRQRVVGGW